MAHNLQIISEAIGELASQVSGIANVETKPKIVAGRVLPSIFVVYEGFRQKPMTFGPSWRMIYNYNLTLYLALDGANLETQWDSLLELSNAIADTFRRSYDLGGIAFKAEIVHGKAIIHIPRNPATKPKWIGHRFSMDVTMEES